ncbi:MAG TPA: hypothetical protein VKP30_29195 [Polyangiaceae bacterium]|nr:hypothetical protein [Polyangiaceae bacterium]
MSGPYWSVRRTNDAQRYRDEQTNNRWGNAKLTYAAAQLKQRQIDGRSGAAGATRTSYLVEFDGTAFLVVTKTEASSG